MRVSWHERAGEFERYAPHAFDRLKGQQAPFKLGGETVGTATVVDVVVDEDGLGVTWTVDVPGFAPQAGRGYGPGIGYGWHGEEQDLGRAWLEQGRKERGW